MDKVVRTLVGGLLLAGVVHVVAVLTIPTVAPADVVDRIERIADPRRIVPIPADGSVVAGLDPLFIHAVCAFDLSHGPAAVTGRMPATIWTAAVVAEPGIVAGAIERAAVPDDGLDLVVGRQEDIDVRRVDRAGADALVSYVASPSDRGFVLLRAFAEREDDRRAAVDALAALRCGPA